MMNKGCFEKSMSDSELADILDLYYQLCSLEVTVKERASKSYKDCYQITVMQCIEIHVGLMIPNQRHNQ